MKKLTLLSGTTILAICLIILSCRKEINNLVDQKGHVPSNILESSRVLYETQATLSEGLIASAERKSSKKTPQSWRKKFVRLNPQWKRAKQISENGKNLLIVPTIENKVLSKKINIRRFFVFELVSGRASKGEIAELIGVDYAVADNLDQLLSSSNHEPINNFSGAVLRYDLNYFQKLATVYENGKISNKKGEFRRTPASKKSAIENGSAQGLATSSNSDGGGTMVALAMATTDLVPSLTGILGRKMNLATRGTKTGR